ncbi:ketose-bisphosphate aldolase [Anoxybacterium hadale]|uniref:Ketose-bisphosphate aldolase n=1 Tax=Anoxybacterium hadale TaxID=3408580 RepID=A0ACD1AGP4_9FIRM|nr:ketose-bisphosphate aldolase [Clostridiales bacterium]
MPLCNMKSLLKEAEQKKKAVGAFNVGNMEMIIAVVKAAEDLNFPVIMQVAEKRLTHSPLDLMGPMMVNAAKRAKVDIAVHFDHGVSFENIQKALDCGFTSVMFDGSLYALEENIKKTSEVVSMASKYGADVEGEIGVVGGNEGGNVNHTICYTDPTDALTFSKRAKLTALAIAIGNAHGNYTVAPDLRFDILEKTAKLVDLPIVLHGGTGLTEEDFKTAIRLGIRKVNIATSCYDALTASAQSYFIKDGHHDFFGLNEAMIEGFYEKVKQHIHIFND